MFIKSDIFYLKNLNLKNCEKGSWDWLKVSRFGFYQLSQLNDVISTRCTKQDPWDFRFSLVKNHIPTTQTRLITQ